jgi:hypothetical protein
MILLKNSVRATDPILTLIRARKGVRAHQGSPEYYFLPHSPYPDRVWKDAFTRLGTSWQSYRRHGVSTFQDPDSQNLLKPFLRNQRFWRLVLLGK